jgi:hypothetical protein
MPREKHAEDALVAIAETIGSTLGSLAATAKKAKKALTPASATRRGAKRVPRSVSENCLLLR